MAVTFFKETHAREGSQGLRERQPVTRYVRGFLVKTNNVNDDATVIDKHPSCPKLGNSHPRDKDAKCVDVDIRQIPSSKLAWVVSVTYTDDRELEDDPLSEPAEITWDSEMFQAPFAFEYSFATPPTFTRRAVVNSAGDPYDPQIEGDDMHLYVTVRKNVKDEVPSWLGTYKRSVNKAQFKLDGYTVGQYAAKLMRVSLSKAIRYGSGGYSKYRVLEYSLGIDNTVYVEAGTPYLGTGWTKVVLDAGFREISGTSGDRVNIKNEDGEDITAPVPLDGSGHKLDNPTMETARRRFHNIYLPQDYLVLPATISIPV